MNLGLLGRKIKMTRIFDKEGNINPITIISCGPCTITQIKSKDYNAIQLGYCKMIKENKKKTKPLIGHFAKNHLSFFRYVKEYKIKNTNNYSIGEVLDLNMFKIKEKVKISGITSGKGFSGNIKRNNFKRGPMSHGSKHHRLQGSIGAGTTPGRVIPGKKMSGHLGNKKKTILNLKIMDIDFQNNLLFIKGSIPGKNNKIVNIQKID